MYPSDLRGTSPDGVAETRGQTDGNADSGANQDTGGGWAESVLNTLALTALPRERCRRATDSVTMPRSADTAGAGEAQKPQNREHHSKQKRFHKTPLIRALAVRIEGSAILRETSRVIDRS